MDMATLDAARRDAFKDYVNSAIHGVFRILQENNNAWCDFDYFLIRWVERHGTYLNAHALGVNHPIDFMLRLQERGLVTVRISEYNKFHIRMTPLAAAMAGGP